MKKKSNKPTFIESDDGKKIRLCQEKGCFNEGEYEAPKSPNSEEKYFFCLHHIKIYNTTKDLVEQKLKNNPHFKDSLFDKLQNKIQQKHDCQEIEAGAYLNWCYFFYVLK